ncbi:MAG: SHOCT domain-containing protein [Solirubrobacterales bacterium]|nr:SHOCT domain-containing protein [Solirubrobacterales bacterium]
MKLAVLGAVVAVAGLALGVDGLVLTGALWLILGLLAWTLITRHRGERSSGRKLTGAEEAEIGRIEGSAGQEKSNSWLGLALLLVIGIGSLAIGIFKVGFTGDSESLRWLPLGAGILVTTFAVITIPARMGASSTAVAAAAGNLVPARVTIEGRRETGTFINEKPRIEFDLLVEPENLPSYRVKKKATVPPTALGNIAVGDGFEAEVNPEKESQIAIDWDAPFEGSSGKDSRERLEKLAELRSSDLITQAEYENQRERILGSI